MKIKSFVFCMMSLVSFIACSSTEELPAPPHPDPPVQGGEERAFINSSYIRQSFYETNRISTESINACTDVILLGFNPYTDGTLYFELPNNDALFTNVDHLNTFDGRNGVISFSRQGAFMNARYDLLNTPQLTGTTASGSVNEFTFGSWVYIDEWIAGSYLLKKEADGKIVALKLGNNAQQLEFLIGTKKVQIQASGLSIKKWVHIALTYQGKQGANNQVKFYLDGELQSGLTPDADFPTAVPYMRAECTIGELLKGKLDETFVSRLAMSQAAILSARNNGLTFTDCNSTKVLAYWKYDIATQIGKDSHSWTDLLADIRTKITNPKTKLRFSISGGDWKAMMSNETSRTNFAKNVKQLIDQYHLDGVDFDFEWAQNTLEYNNYSATVVKLKSMLSTGNLFSLSLHPISYQISKEAINAVDFISLQCYGPAPARFPMSAFKDDAQACLNYGIPKEKLVMGVPFYGVPTDGTKDEVAYFNFVNEGLITNQTGDEVLYKNKKFILNGQRTIREKTRYVLDQSLRGIMSWDLATDVPFSHSLSLLKAVVEESQK